MIIDHTSTTKSCETLSSDILSLIITMAVPYIGSHITLISKSQIRYEGILHSIDPVQSTLALKNGEIFNAITLKKYIYYILCYN